MKTHFTLFILLFSFSESVLLTDVMSPVPPSTRSSHLPPEMSHPFPSRVVQRENAHATPAHLRDVHTVATVDHEIVGKDQLPALVAAAGELRHEAQVAVEDQHRALELVDDQEI